MPVRKIPKNYRNVTGVAARSKAIGQAMFESTLERDLITLLQFDSRVSRFEVQPMRIEWCDDSGSERAYTPDVLAYFDDSDMKTTLYEAKYRSELKADWQNLKPKFKAAIKCAREQGWRFKIITEKEIRTPHLENAKFLLPFIQKGPQNETDMDVLDGTLRELKQSTPNVLLTHIYEDEWNRAKLMPTLWYLVGTGHFGSDFNSKLTMNSPIWKKS